MLCIALPYIPGPYDPFAAALSFTAQVSGFAALLFVPIGVLWLISEYRRKKNRLVSNQKHLAYKIATLVLVVILTLLVAVGAFASHNYTLGLLFAVICAFMAIRTKIILGRPQKTYSNMDSLPLYLVTIPLVVVAFRTMFIIPIVNAARDQAIKNSQAMISDIESYHARNGQYPLSLLSLSSDYKTGVIGIKQYHYEPNGKGYNLYFELLPHQLDIREIVMYNKMNEQEMTSHDADLLQLSSTQLNLQRGYVAMKELRTIHWKSFLFD